MACHRVTITATVAPLAVAAALAVIASLSAGCTALPAAAETLGPALAVPYSEPQSDPLPVENATTAQQRQLVVGEPLPAPQTGSPLGLETLADAWAAAQAADTPLEVLQLQAAAHDEELLAARAQRWPTATLGGAYVVRSDEPSIELPALGPGLSPALLPYAPLDQVLLRGQIALPLYTGNRITSEIEAAAARSAGMEHKVTQYRLDRKLLIAQEFLAVLRADHEVEIAASQVRNLEAHLRGAEALLARGSASRQDLLEAQVALADARHQALVAIQAQEFNRATFNQRMGRPFETPVRLDPISVPPVEDDLVALTERALAQNAEIRELQAQAAALGYDAEAAAAAKRPQVHMLGAYTYNENPFQDPQGLAEAGLAVSWNIYDGGGGRHRTSARRFAAAAATRHAVDVASRIELDVRRVWLEATAAREGLRVTDQANALAEEKLRSVRIRFASGTTTSGEVLQCEAQRVRALRNHYRAHDTAALASLRLLHATGDL